MAFQLGDIFRRVGFRQTNNIHAGTYHRFYDTCRVLPQGDESPGPLHTARLALCDATRTVLASGLGLLNDGDAVRVIAPTAGGAP